MKATIRTLTFALSLLTILFALFACGGSDAKGYAFKTPNGGEIAIGDKADDALAAAGSHLSMSESASCGGIEGMDRLYVYNGFRMKTTPSEKGDVVCEIALTNDSLKTPEGLYIGMAEADVKSAMSGKGSAETVGTNLVYQSGDMKLQVNISGGYVTAITYLAK